MTIPPDGSTAADTYLHDGQLVRILADGAATGGACTVLEVLAPLGSGLPCHVHEHEDETVHVLEGRLFVGVGDEARDLRAGEVIHLPRGVPHRVVAASAEARFIAVHVPAGVEAFVRATGEAAAPGALDPSAVAPLAIDDDVAAHLTAAGLRLLPARSRT